MRAGAVMSLFLGHLAPSGETETVKQEDIHTLLISLILLGISSLTANLVFPLSPPELQQPPRSAPLYFLPGLVQ